MLSKDLTPNPKAVNIIRPSNNNFFVNHQHSLNYSSSTDSSTRTFSTASTLTKDNTTFTPMIRQPSIESNPGLSFFCQSTSPANNNHNIVLKNNTTSVYNTKHSNNDNHIHQKQQQQHLQPQQPQQPTTTTLFEKIQSQPPLVISRINLSNFQHRRPTVSTDLEEIDDEGITTLDEQEEMTDALKSSLPIKESATNMVRVPSFQPAGGFGILNGTGLGSFMLRGNIAQQQAQQQIPVVDEARVNRKIEDLEIEKKSLLTLNQTLETVVKEQSNTISNLQDKLAAIERPLTPGLDTSLSKNGIMSSTDILESSDLERYLEDEDKAFERIRVMLLELIEQAQSAVTQNKKAIGGRVLSDYDVNKNNSMKRNEANYYGRPRSVAGDRSSNTRNLTIPNRTPTRRVSLGSMNSTISSTAAATTTGRLSSSPITIASTTDISHKSMSSSPTISPIPHRRYSIQQRSASRPSSPALLSKSESNTSIHSATSKASKYSIKHKPISHQQESQIRKWLN